MHWLRSLFHRRQIYSDLSEEIQQHLAEKVEALMAGGMSRKDAEFAARREFGTSAKIHGPPCSWLSSRTWANSSLPAQ